MIRQLLFASPIFLSFCPYVRSASGIRDSVAGRVVPARSPIFFVEIDYPTVRPLRWVITRADHLIDIRCNGLGSIRRHPLLWKRHPVLIQLPHHRTGIDLCIRCISSYPHTLGFRTGLLSCKRNADGWIGYEPLVMNLSNICANKLRRH